MPRREPASGALHAMGIVPFRHAYEMYAAVGVGAHRGSHRAPPRERALCGAGRTQHDQVDVIAAGELQEGVGRIGRLRWAGCQMLNSSSQDNT